VGLLTLDIRRTEAEIKERTPFFARSISNPTNSELSLVMNVGVVLVVLCKFFIPHRAPTVAGEKAHDGKGNESTQTTMASLPKVYNMMNDLSQLALLKIL